MSWPAAMGVRAVLAPPGHPPEHQLRVAGEALVGPDAEALHHARPEPLDQRVGALDEVEQRGDAVGVLEVDGDVAPAAAARRRRAGVVGRRAAHRLGAVDADDVGAHVGEQHRGERAGPDAGDLDDPVAVSGPDIVRPFSRPSPDRRRGSVWLMMASTISGHSGLGQVVAHVGEQQEVGVGDRLGGQRAAARRDQRVVAPVDDERRHLDARRARRCGRRWRRWRRAGGRRPPGRTPGRRRGGPVAGPLGVEVALRRPDRGAVGGGDVGVAVASAAARSSTSSASGVGLPTRGSPGELITEIRLRHRSGARWRSSGRSSRPSTRPARGPARCRGGRAGRRRRRPCPTACTAPAAARCRSSARRHHGHRLDALAVEVGRQPAVAVVEADDVAPACGEQLAELGVPGDQLGGEPHHEQQRRVVGRAERLVLDLDGVGFVVATVARGIAGSLADRTTVPTTDARATR